MRSREARCLWLLRCCEVGHKHTCRKTESHGPLFWAFQFWLEFIKGRSLTQSKVVQYDWFTCKLLTACSDYVFGKSVWVCVTQKRQKSPFFQTQKNTECTFFSQSVSQSVYIIYFFWKWTQIFLRITQKTAKIFEKTQIIWVKKTQKKHRKVHTEKRFSNTENPHT